MKNIKRIILKLNILCVLIIAVCTEYCIDASAICLDMEYQDTTYQDTTYLDIFSIAMDIVNWKKSTYNKSENEALISGDYMDLAATTSGDWFVIGISRLGLKDDYDAYYSKIENIVKERYESEGTLHKVKATEYHRVIFAVLASGGNPQNVAGVNLIKNGIYDRANVAALDKQGINGYIFALIAADANAYEFPENVCDTREDIINGILEKELTNGGFSLTGTALDVDVTAMAIQALSNYYDREDVKGVVDRALLKLSSLQKDDGDFVSYGYANSESTAQVVIALTSLGIDPLTDERFIKNGNTLFDGMMKYRMEDGGFAHCFGNPSYKEESNSMASEQILLAMVAMLREHNDMNKLYDFGHEEKNLYDIYCDEYNKIKGNLNNNVLEGNETEQITFEVISKFVNEHRDEKTTQYQNEIIKYQSYMANIMEEQAVLAEEIDNINASLLIMYENMKSAENEIKSLVNDINSSVYPIEDISLKDKSVIDGLIDRYNNLSEYDKGKITNYEDLKRADTIIKTTIRRYIIFAVILCVVIVLSISVILKKRSRKKQVEMFQYEDE